MRDEEVLFLGDLLVIILVSGTLPFQQVPSK